MVFGEILASVDGRRRRLVFYNADTLSSHCDRIIDYVGVYDVIIKYTTDEQFPEATVVIQDGEEILSVDSIETVANYLDAWESELSAVGEQPSLFEALDETVFRSANNRQLLLASRLIETRAARIGHGRLSAGFQQLSLAVPQLPFYTTLPSALSVSLYGEPDWLPPADSGIAAYDPGVEAHADYWWVVFDGTPQGHHHAALLAEERASGEYTGFWTYRPSIIARIRERIERLDARRVC